MTQLEGWGRTSVAWSHVSGSLPDMVSSRGITPRGAGRSYGDAAQNSGGHVVDLTRRPCREPSIDAATATVTVGAGCTLRQFEEHLAGHGWMLPVVPGTSRVTVGGAIASDIHGKNQEHRGNFVDHVVSCTVVDHEGSGRLATSGSDDLNAIAGGMGLTGLVTEATLRIVPLLPSYEVTTMAVTGIRDIISAFESLPDHPERVAWLDLAAPTPRGVVELARPIAEDIGPAPQRSITIPDITPFSLLQPATIRAYNALRFGAAKRAEGRHVVARATFNHPLDQLDRWNRLFGHGGLVQYQALVPDEDTLFQLFDVVRSIDGPPSLAVLKQMARGRGLLSFPGPGWTLALDWPTGTGGLARTLDRADHLVAASGGRIYLTKDARLSPRHLDQMYPEIDRWRSIADRFDPEHHFTSDLDRRLGLRRPIHA